MLFLLACWTDSEATKTFHRFPKVEIHIRDQSYTVEYAQELHEVELGLRHRTIGEDEGILLYTKPLMGKGMLSMDGMKSDISAAFIDSEYRIRKIIPLDMTAKSKPIPLYADFIWEMPQGWFAKMRIEKDTQLSGLPTP